jgi:hypothetical protein
VVSSWESDTWGHLRRYLRHSAAFLPTLMSLPRKIYRGLPCGCQRYHNLHFSVLLYLPEGPSTCSLPDLPVCFPSLRMVMHVMVYPSGSHNAVAIRLAMLPKSSPGTICESLINRSGGTIVSSNQIFRSASRVSHFRTEPVPLRQCAIYCSTVLGSFLVWTQKWTLET